ncbi:MAG: GNAT family N-acetyltransferase [Ruminococcaceae bacterium]|nr:GNAT family N-acetyltransferase [Oscillospiraceae bacterium]
MMIKRAEISHFEAVKEIYDGARRFMKEKGNPNQWIGGYPQDQVIFDDIKEKKLFLCEENGEILGVFCCFFGNDPTYEKIFDGEWLNDRPYAVIHRIAVAENAHGRGVASLCFDYAFGICGNVKIDTHKDNIPMQRALKKNGFTPCGKIYLKNGDERIAFQKSK